MYVTYGTTTTYTIDTHGYIHTLVMPVYSTGAPTMYLLPGNTLPYMEMINRGQGKDIKWSFFIHRLSDFCAINILRAEILALHPVIAPMYMLITLVRCMDSGMPIYGDNE